MSARSAGSRQGRGDDDRSKIVAFSTVEVRCRSGGKDRDARARVFDAPRAATCRGRRPTAGISPRGCSPGRPSWPPSRRERGGSLANALGLERFRAVWRWRELVSAAARSAGSRSPPVDSVVRGHLDGARGWMPAIWRPNVSGALPDVDVEVGVAEDASSKGTKRKSPSHEGAMRARGKVSVAMQCAALARTGSGALGARSAVGLESASTVVSGLSARCGGGSICEHGRIRSQCKSAVGGQSASTVVSALAKECDGGANLRARSSALSVQGVRWYINLRARSNTFKVQGVSRRELMRVVMNAHPPARQRRPSLPAL